MPKEELKEKLAKTYKVCNCKCKCPEDWRAGGKGRWDRRSWCRVRVSCEDMHNKKRKKFFYTELRITPVHRLGLKYEAVNIQFVCPLLGMLQYVFTAYLSLVHFELWF